MKDDVGSDVTIFHHTIPRILSDQGSLALIDEFMTGLGSTRQLHQVFPAPESGKGIKAADNVRTLVCTLPMVTIFRKNWTRLNMNADCGL